MATKLNAVRGRAEVRDYIDLMAMEKLAGLMVEEGIGLLEVRYPEAAQKGEWREVIRALASFEDVRGSAMPKMKPGFKVTVRQVEKYWQQRVKEIVRHLDMVGTKEVDF